jgi:hypothetical protein
MYIDYIVIYVTLKVQASTGAVKKRMIKNSEAYNIARSCADIMHLAAYIHVSVLFYTVGK